MSVDGTYDVTVKTPLGVQPGRLSLVSDGDALTGTLQNRLGTFEIEDGSVSGNQVHFFAPVKTPLGQFRIEITGEVAGDTYSGIGKLPLGTVRVEGRRA
ncbi:MAG: hypothetical protein KKH72_05620 [Alphaproteobacteria bacterium]|nr:hypothetical protein [Alphaproteobacteria bacterium]